MPTATEKALKAKKDYDALIQAAIKEQLGIIKTAEARLTELGYSNGSAPARTAAKTAAKPSKKQTRQLDPNKPCALCKFATVPNHDTRKHRGQKPQKAFTPKELEERGLKKKAA